ncbi:hypothetical protein B296_00003067 [Ensete ventricosum]|uniref:Retrotransposon gag domain-containing protein n=1 Tax=Ensete ventricosum TaxID=4639 RepID=A0A427B7N3_ENSVE|nr:hypothetical protein B296_00003067 [Ensete ventricosum]
MMSGRSFTSPKKSREKALPGDPLSSKRSKDKLIPLNFRLPSLEVYDRNSDPTEYIPTFRAQIALYDTSNALIYRAFLTTLRGLAQMWYNHLKLLSFSSFGHMVKEFEFNFLASAKPKPYITFEARDTEYPDHDEALVILVCIANVQVKRVMVDIDSSADVLYHNTFLKLGLTATNLTSMYSMLTEFTGDSITPLIITFSPITLGPRP